MKKIYGVAILALLVTAAGYLWFSKSSAKSQVQYLTAVAEKGTLISSVSGSGNVIVDQSATVDPTISGTVTGLKVKAGDSVKEGQLLFRIENDQLEVSVSKSLSTYQQAKNSLASAKVQKKQAKADLKDAKNGTTSKAQTPTANQPSNMSGSSNQNTDTSQNETTEKPSAEQIEVLEDKVSVADSAIKVAEQNLDAALADYRYQRSITGKKEVSAPIGGIVNEVNIKNGDDLGKGATSSSSASMSASQTQATTSSSQSPIIIGDLNTLKAQVQVNEVDIPKVKVGQKATLKFDAFENLGATGKVEKISSLGTVSQGVVTYDVTIELNELDSRIKPQMSVTASIITKVNQDTIIVPNSALKSNGSDGYYVEVLSKQIPQAVNVEIGAANNKETEVLSGIDEGAKVVTQTIDPNATTTNTSSGFRMPGAGMGGGGGASRGSGSVMVH